MDNKLSIIIPAYNIDGYLASTLDSVLAQTYKNIEVIVVNDGSKDDTASIIDNYDSKYPVVKGIHKENGGVTSARLRGVEEATGDWIGFVDGDDFIEPEMFERLMNNALKHDADISHCGYQMIFPDGKIDYYYNTGKLISQNNIDGLRDLVSGVAYEPALCNKIYKKDLFIRLLKDNLMDSSIKITEDLLMNYWLFKEAKTSVFEDFCPYHYVLRRNSAATSKLNRNKLLDPLKVIRIIYEDVPAQLKDMMFSRLIRQLIALATRSAKHQQELIKPHRKSARKELRSLLGKVIKSKISKKVKIMALWAGIWPASYCFIHNIHGKATGNADKYNIG